MLATNSRKSAIIAFIAFTLAAILTVLAQYKILPISEPILEGIRWVAILTLVIFAYVRKNLTTWILVSMVIGAEIGNDFHEIALHMNLFSKIFLKLIKTIIAPLIFGTLV